MSQDSVKGRHISITDGRLREARFFNHSYSRAVKVPHVVYSYGSELFGEYPGFSFLFFFKEMKKEEENIKKTDI